MTAQHQITSANGSESCNAMVGGGRVEMFAILVGDNLQQFGRYPNRAMAEGAAFAMGRTGFLILTQSEAVAWIEEVTADLADSTASIH
jgi:hypothetical protein